MERLSIYENAILLYLTYYSFDEHKNLEAVILILVHIDSFISPLELVIERKAESASDVEHALAQVSNTVISHRMSHLLMTVQHYDRLLTTG